MSVKINEKTIIEYLLEGNNKEDLAKLYISKLSKKELDNLKKEVEEYGE